jgi:hypothetical protein
LKQVENQVHCVQSSCSEVLVDGQDVERKVVHYRDPNEARKVENESPQRHPIRVPNVE